MLRTGWLLAGFLVVVNVLTVANRAHAQTGYRLPPQEVVDIIDARPEPGVSFSPDGNWRVLLERDAMPTLADVSRRMLQLAGLRIDPVANGPFQLSYTRGLTLQARDGSQSTRLPLPPGARIGRINWSHRNDRFAFALVTDKGTELWMAPVAEPAAPKRLTDRLSLVLAGFDWLPDGQRFYCQLVPADRGAEPAAGLASISPAIQESSGNTSPTRTYQDLLKSPHDEALFEYYATTQMALIDSQGKIDTIGRPAMFNSVSASPDGEHLLVTTTERPFSFLQPAGSFPKKIGVWDLKGNVTYPVIDVPLAENIPIEGVRIGPRGIHWAPNRPATLVWTEALDGGDPRTKAPHRDRLMLLAAPFKEAAKELLKTEHRFRGANFFDDPNLLLVNEFDRDRRWERSKLHRLDQPTAEPRVFDDRSAQDRYGDPGNILHEPTKTGHGVVRQDGSWIFLAGQGATPEGPRPFLDRRNLETLATERLWRCEPGEMESLSLFVTANGGKPQFITSHQSSTTPPNYFLRDLAAGTRMPITTFKDPTPQIRGIKKQLVKYQRPDGVPLSATLYLPANHQPGQRLPLIVWAYPVEYNDAGTAGQVSANPNTFTRMTGITHLTLLTQGYSIMDDATMPVIGAPETMNDTFVEQITGAAKAAIDKAAELGVGDPNRVGVGGHSYGGFMTANLLAHCDLFRAGVARSGAYNRTLTPFGFQSERRPLWEAQDVYARLSPFMYADKIKEPLLLIHGENDDNTGTFPIQSQRMYQAVKGNGGTVRLVMLPYEAHGYSARESVLHTQAEMIGWFNKYVRDASPAPAEPTPAKPAQSGQ